MNITQMVQCEEIPYWKPVKLMNLKVTINYDVKITLMHAGTHAK